VVAERFQISLATAVPSPYRATTVRYDDDLGGHFTKVMTLLAGIIGEGQDADEIRAGNAHAIARLYSVLINEHVLLAAERDPNIGRLTAEQFHGLIDGTLRKPAH
jgi:hypothetical protein